MFARLCSSSCLPLLVTPALGCASHVETTAVDPLTEQLSHGILFDSPNGTFSEVIVSNQPIDCDSVSYHDANTSGWVTDESIDPWIGISLNETRQTFMAHVDGLAIGPGQAEEFKIDSWANSEPTAVGDSVMVEWYVETFSVIEEVAVFNGYTGPTSVTYCGVFAPE